MRDYAKYLKEEEIYTLEPMFLLSDTYGYNKTMKGEFLYIDFSRRNSAQRLSIFIMFGVLMFGVIALAMLSSQINRSNILYVVLPLAFAVCLFLMECMFKRKFKDSNGLVGSSYCRFNHGDSSWETRSITGVYLCKYWQERNGSALINGMAEIFIRINEGGVMFYPLLRVYNIQGCDQLAKDMADSAKCPLIVINNG